MSTDSGAALNKPFDFVSTSEAANLLGVSLRTVQKWVENGSLVAWKTNGGHRRIVRASVARLVAQQQHAVTEGSAQGRFQLLVVEDDPRQRRLHELSADQWGLPLDLHLACDGFEGLLKAGNLKPDMIVVDLQMPGMNGFRMIEAIRRDPAIMAEIIVVTGLSAAEIEQHGGVAAGIRVFQKPVSMNHIRDVVVETMRARGTRVSA